MSANSLQTGGIELTREQSDPLFVEEFGTQDVRHGHVLLLGTEFPCRGDGEMSSLVLIDDAGEYTVRERRQDVWARKRLTTHLGESK